MGVFLSSRNHFPPPFLPHYFKTVACVPMMPTPYQQHHPIMGTHTGTTTTTSRRNRYRRLQKPALFLIFVLVIFLSSLSFLFHTSFLGGGEPYRRKLLFNNNNHYHRVVRRMGAWNMTVSIVSPSQNYKNNNDRDTTTSSHLSNSPTSSIIHRNHEFPRQFLYKFKTTQDAFRLPLPIFLDAADVEKSGDRNSSTVVDDRAEWLSHPQPFGGCRSIGTHTCHYSEDTYGVTMNVHTYASLKRMTRVPCVDYDFDQDIITYHNVSSLTPSASTSARGRRGPSAVVIGGVGGGRGGGRGDVYVDNGVDNLIIDPSLSSASPPVCENATLVPLFVPQGGYFAHFMDGAFPRLAVALAHREARGDLHERLHILLLPEHQSDDTYQIINALPNVTVTFSRSVPVGVCYKRIVSVCHSSPGFDPRTGHEINRLVRNAFYREDRPPLKHFEATMQALYNPYKDTRHQRRGRFYQNPVYNKNSDNSLRESNHPTDAPTTTTNNPLKASPKCTTRVYASRVKGNRNGRTTPNEESVIQHLKVSYNFTIFEGGEPLSQWAVAMKDACVFVGAHGGAMSHMFWLNPDLNPAVIEFDGYNKYSIFWYLAASMGFNYGWMNFDKARGLDINRLDALLGKFGVMPVGRINATHSTLQLLNPPPT